MLDFGEGARGTGLQFLSSSSFYYLQQRERYIIEGQLRKQRGGFGKKIQEKKNLVSLRLLLFLILKLSIDLFWVKTHVYICICISIGIFMIKLIPNI